MYRMVGFFILSTAFGADVGIFVPEQILECLSSQTSKLSVDEAVNPFFVRGDIDGDGDADYVVAVKNAGIGQPGILICVNAGKHVLFSGGTSRVPEGLTLASDQSLSAVGWTFVGKIEVRTRLKRPDVAARMKGEALLLQYEDDRALIFWDGSKYRWIGWFQ